MKLYTTLILCLLSTILWAQPPNDDCSGAIFIPNVSNYCSGVTQYSNVNATPDPAQADLCLQNYTNGVWFAFQPLSLGAFIEVIGTGNGSATLTNPTVSLFLGSCQSLDYQICAPGSQDRCELSAVNLFLGATYYLYVENNAGNSGSFQLCITEFNPVPVPQSDCPEAVTLCDKSPFFVEFLGNGGNIEDEIVSSCLSGETSSSWYQWECDESGTLEFTLTPNDFVNSGIESDDIDFVVYEMPNGLGDCSDLIELRCMASGENGNQPFSTWSICVGPTGLIDGDGDLSEQPGCQAGNNNFAEALDMVSGTAYLLVINNFTVSGLGFSIEFGGSGTFVGPEADFTAETVGAFECDKSIVIDNIDISSPDEIIEYQWSFGAGADVSTITGEGPHTIIYESFGEKLIALTVTTERGCVVTKILDLFIEPCCADTSNLMVDATAQDVICAGDLTGLISATGSNGNPEYSYSLDGETFSPIANFSGLGAGEYTVYIQDIKGCINQTTLDILEPDPFMIDAGEDMEVALGCSVDLIATYSPPTDIVTVDWTAGTVLSCTDCLDPTATPAGTTTYVIQAENQNGCTSTDNVTISTNANRDFFAPNVFSPLAPSPNDMFMIGTAKGTDFLNLFIYDRWGELVYQKNNIERNDFSSGWDGSFNGREANIGVYTWMAEVHYLDDVVNIVAGDVTLVR